MAERLYWIMLECTGVLNVDWCELKLWICTSCELATDISTNFVNLYFRGKEHLHA